MINKNIRDFVKNNLKYPYRIKYLWMKCFGNNINLSIKEANDIVNKLNFEHDVSIKADNKLNKIYDLMVIIPTYNCADFIEKCVESVINQRTTYKIEIIIINDGSTDHTGDILKKYEDINNVKIITQQNRGLSGARDAALKNITGKYIFFLDADDYLPSDTAIQNLLDIGIKNDADIVEGSAYSFYYNKGKIEKNRDIVHSYEGRVCSSTDMMGYPWGKIYKAELFKNVKFPSHLWFEDTIISLLLYPQTSKKFITNKLVYAYQVNYNGITHASKGSKKNIDTYLITDLIIKEISKYGKINKETEKLFLNQLAMNYRRLKGVSKKLNYAVIVLSINLYHQYFTVELKNDLLNKKEKKLKKAIKQNNKKEVNALLNCWNYL